MSETILNDRETNKNHIANLLEELTLVYQNSK